MFLCRKSCRLMEIVKITCLIAVWYSSSTVADLYSASLTSTTSLQEDPQRKNYVKSQEDHPLRPTEERGEPNLCISVVVFALFAFGSLIGSVLHQGISCALKVNGHSEKGHMYSQRGGEQQEDSSSCCFQRMIPFYLVGSYMRNVLVSGWPSVLNALRFFFWTVLFALIPSPRSFFRLVRRSLLLFLSIEKCLEQQPPSNSILAAGTPRVVKVDVDDSGKEVVEKSYRESLFFLSNTTASPTSDSLSKDYLCRCEAVLLWLVTVSNVAGLFLMFSAFQGTNRYPTNSTTPKISYSATNTVSAAYAFKTTEPLMMCLLSTYPMQRFLRWVVASTISYSDDMTRNEIMEELSENIVSEKKYHTAEVGREYHFGAPPLKTTQNVVENRNDKKKLDPMWSLHLLNKNELQLQDDSYCRRKPHTASSSPPTDSVPLPIKKQHIVEVVSAGGSCSQSCCCVTTTTLITAISSSDEERDKNNHGSSHCDDLTIFWTVDPVPNTSMWCAVAVICIGATLLSTTVPIQHGSIVTNPGEFLSSLWIALWCRPSLLILVSNGCFALRTTLQKPLFNLQKLQLPPATQVPIVASSVFVKVGLLGGVLLLPYVLLFHRAALHQLTVHQSVELVLAACGYTVYHTCNNIVLERVSCVSYAVAKQFRVLAVWLATILLFSATLDDAVQHYVTVVTALVLVVGGTAYYTFNSTVGPNHSNTMLKAHMV